MTHVAQRTAHAYPANVLLLQPSCSKKAKMPAVSTAMRLSVVVVQLCSTTPCATAPSWRATCVPPGRDHLQVIGETRAAWWTNTAESGGRALVRHHAVRTSSVLACDLRPSR